MLQSEYVCPIAVYLEYGFSRARGMVLVVLESTRRKACLLGAVHKFRNALRGIFSTVFNHPLHPLRNHNARRFWWFRPPPLRFVSRYYTHATRTVYVHVYTIHARHTHWMCERVRPYTYVYTLTDTGTLHARNVTVRVYKSGMDAYTHACYAQ